MNKWVGIGRLTKDPELRYSQSGVAITAFTIAVDRRFKNAQGEKETDFIQIKTFKQLAELCANYLAKGKLAAVTGELHINSYTDKEGVKKWITEINADEVQFLSPKDDNAGQSQPQQTQQQYTTPPGQPQQQQYGAPSQGPGQYGTPPGYPPQAGQAPPPPGYGQAPGYLPQGAPAQGQWQGNPTQGPAQGPPGSVPSSQYGHPVNIDPDSIPF